MLLRFPLGVVVKLRVKCLSYHVEAVQLVRHQFGNYCAIFSAWNMDSYEVDFAQLISWD